MSVSGSASTYGPGNQSISWLRALRRYIFFVALANLIWEFAHLPLYTLWETGTAEEIVFAAVHCTGGDILIALSTIMLSLFLFGTGAWPGKRRLPVVAATVLFGVAYTIFSEWLNIEVREAWAYGDLMPVIPVLEAGLSPVLQWIIVPLAGFRFATAFPVVPPCGNVTDDA
ncbi:MAG: hypothetical protein RLW87_20975 [Alphaproteobacteria bacterium]|nr:hypothetical protein [Alphaproteobacteria bacterium]